MIHRLTVMDRYIGKEILSSWSSVLLILILVVMSVETVHLLSWLAEGRIPADALWSYLANGLFEFSVLLVPLSMLMGVLLAFGRLYKDSEMTAIMSAGFGPVQWYRPLLMIAIPISTLMLFLMLYVMPLISEQRDELIAETKERTDISSFFAGRFNLSRKGDAVFFLEGKSDDGNVMHHVFNRQIRTGEDHIDIAEFARRVTNKEGLDYTIMENGTHYIGAPGSTNLRIIEYGEYGVYVRGSRTGGGGVRKSLKSMSTAELWNANQPVHAAELQWRITIPLATLIIALLALPLSQTTPRSGRYAKLAWAIILYLLYSNLLGVGKTWIAQGTVPAWIGTWWVHLLALGLLLILLIRSGYVVLYNKQVTSAQLIQ